MLSRTHCLRIDVHVGVNLNRGATSNSRDVRCKESTYDDYHVMSSDLETSTGSPNLQVQTGGTGPGSIQVLVNTTAHVGLQV